MCDMIFDCLFLNFGCTYIEVFPETMCYILNKTTFLISSTLKLSIIFSKPVILCVALGSQLNCYLCDEISNFLILVLTYTKFCSIKCFHDIDLINAKLLSLYLLNYYKFVCKIIVLSSNLCP